MSANLYWEPTKRKKNYLPIGAPLSFMESLKRVFGNRTPTLTEKDIPILRGMAVVASGDAGECYKQLADAVEKYEEIEVTAVY